MKIINYILFTIFTLICFYTNAQEPEQFLKELGSNKVEYGLTITPDKKIVYFVKTDSFYVTKPKAIYKSKMLNGKWSEPQKVSFSGNFSDSSPFVTPDGKRLFFASRRPVNGKPVKNNNIWYVDLKNGQEGKPVFIKEVNSEEGAYSPSVDAFGNLYFGSVRDGGEGWGDLWWSEFKDGKYQVPQNLGSTINSKHGEWGSCISPSGKFIIFENSGKPQNQSASGDLYIAFKENDEWQKPIYFKNKLNSVGSDLTPKIHGDTFYFASNRENNYEPNMNWNNVDLYTLPLTEVLNSIEIESQIKFVIRDYFKDKNNTSAGISWLDFNNDSYPDIFISNAQKQNNVLYINQKGKGFTTKEIDNITNDQSSTSAAAWADFDNDGDQDVLFANQHGEDNRLFINEKDVFKLHQTFDKGDTYHANWIDYNNDGFLDCFIPNAQTGITQLFQQKNKKFSPLVNVISELKGFHSGTSWLDINNDNYQDLYIPIAGANDEFFKYNGAMKNFVGDNTILGKTIGNKNFTSGISFGDYNNDGDMDAFLANLNNQKNILLTNVNSVFHFDSDGLLDDELSSWVGLWGDYDNDGDLDLVVTNYDQPNSIFENIGGLFFKVNIPNITDKAFFSSGVAWADYNKDGFLDIAFANWEKKENLFLEGVSNSNNWVVFKLIGKKSNRDAIGAKVTISYGDNNIQYREMQSNMGLRSYPQRIAHFGLGNYESNITVSVVWPSGKKQKFNISELNTYYSITEDNSKPKKL